MSDNVSPDGRVAVVRADAKKLTAMVDELVQLRATVTALTAERDALLASRDRWKDTAKNEYLDGIIQCIRGDTYRARAMALRQQCVDWRRVGRTNAAGAPAITTDAIRAAP